MDLVPVFTPRIDGKGLFVDKDELGAANLFSFHEFPNWTICTDSVKLFIEENRFTNVIFLHYGEVV
jgi:hypothetical protein